MIYDIRQSTTYVYASTVAHAHHVLRLTADQPRRPARACRGARDRARAAAAPRGPGLLRQPPDLDRPRGTARPTLTIKVAARVSVEPLTRPIR